MNTKQNEFQLERVNSLFDIIRASLKKPNDKMLATLLDLFPSTLATLRKGRIPIGATLILKIALVTGIDITVIKAYLNGENVTIHHTQFQPVTDESMREKVFDTDFVNQLFNTISDNFALRNDKQLAYFLGLNSPVVSKYRTGKLPLGSSVIVRIIEKTGMPTAMVMELLTKPVDSNANKIIVHRTHHKSKTFEAYIADIESHVRHLKKVGPNTAKMRILLEDVVNFYDSQKPLEGPMAQSAED